MGLGLETSGVNHLTHGYGFCSGGEQVKNRELNYKMKNLTHLDNQERHERNRMNLLHDEALERVNNLHHLFRQTHII